MLLHGRKPSHSVGAGHDVDAASTMALAPVAQRPIVGQDGILRPIVNRPSRRLHFVARRPIYNRPQDIILPHKLSRIPRHQLFLRDS